jgi:hypothetical protein
MADFKLYIIPTEHISERVGMMVDSMIRAEVCFKAVMCIAVEEVYFGPDTIPYDDILIGYDKKSDFDVDFDILQLAITYATSELRGIVNHLGIDAIQPSTVDVDSFGDVLITVTTSPSVSWY